jgi:nucleoside triphosphate diphosphatase
MDQIRLSKAMNELIELVRRLRGPDGCPWDAAQTAKSVRMYLLEEAYEVLDAIERGEPEEVRSELGDLLFQIVFLAYLAEEEGRFDFAEVVEEITEKMIRRHPHVFGDVKVRNAEEVAVNWAAIKKTERGHVHGAGGFLGDVSANLPALQWAHRLGERASKVGFDWPDRESVWEKVHEEIDELKDAMGRNESAMVEEELGDLLFSLVNLARHWGLSAEDLLRKSNAKFVDRFESMESALSSSGKALTESTLKEMDRIWNKIKNGTG